VILGKKKNNKHQEIEKLVESLRALFAGEKRPQ